LPEPGERPPDLGPASPTSVPPAPENQLLSRMELELPDGRYLLAYRRLEATPSDA